jgi:hypothetical protein
MSAVGKFMPPEAWVLMILSASIANTNNDTINNSISLIPIAILQYLTYLQYQCQYLYNSHCFEWIHTEQLFAAYSEKFEFYFYHHTRNDAKMCLGCLESNMVLYLSEIVILNCCFQWFAIILVC